MNWETGMDVCALECVKEATNKNRLYSMGKSTQRSVVNGLERSPRGSGCMYVLIH